MFNFGRAEKYTIIFLTATLLLGAGVIAYNKSKPASDIRIEKFTVEKMPAGVSSSLTAVININEADAKELMGLKGVGKVLAQRIVEYRSSKGRYISKEDIKNVEGIGGALYDKIKDDISLE
jgi:competence protein ComEA